MSEIANIGIVFPASAAGKIAPAPTLDANNSRLRDADIVEFSSEAKALARAVGESSLRIARARAIRSEIEGGTFETAERVAGTVDRLLDVIG